MQRTGTGPMETRWELFVAWLALRIAINQCFAEHQVDIWSFSNAASVELTVNGVVVEGGKQPMTKFGHVQWDKVPFKKGSYTVKGFDESGIVVGQKTVKSTGAPATLRATVVNQVDHCLNQS